MPNSTEQEKGWSGRQEIRFDFPSLCFISFLTLSKRQSFHEFQLPYLSICSSSYPSHLTKVLEGSEEIRYLKRFCKHKRIIRWTLRCWAKGAQNVDSHSGMAGLTDWWWLPGASHGEEFWGCAWAQWERVLGLIINVCHGQRSGRSDSCTKCLPFFL